MTNKQILKKAIEKAIENGFDFNTESVKYTGIGVSSPKYVIDNSPFEAIKAIIFSHDFAKAFWGNGTVYMLDCSQDYDVQWQYHLRTMVLKKDPIKYLEKFLK